MTLRHMKLFCAVCEQGCNTTRAAEVLHMTQPAGSLAIRELEQYYGVLLFDRIGRRLQITEAGRHLLRYAVHICVQFDEMETELRDWDTFGILRVGASITVGSQFLPKYVKAFSNIRPQTEVRAVVEPSDRLEKKILENELDFVLMEGVVHDSALVSEAYMEDHLVVICPADGRWKQGEIIMLEEFKRQKFLLREPGSGTREVFDRAIEAKGFSVTPVWEAMSTAALINAAINGLGIAVLPHRLAEGPVEQGLVVSVDVEGLDFRRYFYIVHHKDKYLTASAKVFLDLCRRYEADYPPPHFGGMYEKDRQAPICD